MSAPDKPDPTQWTLRFKCHRTTIILLVSPTSSFTSIKSTLLSSIRATGATTIPQYSASVPLPTSPDDVILGLPIDRNDLSSGWVDLLIPEIGDEEDGPANGKNKGGGVKKGSVLNESPTGAGLRDGDIVAFRFRKEGEEEGVGDGEWDVVIPSYDEEDAEEAAAKMEK